MKINLPTTLTQQKMSTLFLLTLLQTIEVKAGQNLANCFSAQWGLNNPYYNMILNYPFATDATINSNNPLYLCCDKSQSACSSIAANATCASNDSHLSCSEIAQNIFCAEHSGKCGGIVGNNPITANTTVGTCSSDLATVASYVNTATQGGISASTLICPTTSACSGLKCWLDNCGWTCAGYGATYGGCFFQWPIQISLVSTSTSANGPVNSESVLITPSASSTNFSSSNGSSDSGSNNLIMEIAIPTGVGVGASLLGGGAAYYLIRRKLAKKTNREQGVGLNEITSQEELNNLPRLPDYQEAIGLVELPTRGVIHGFQQSYKPNEQYIAQIEVAGSVQRRN